MEEPFPEKFKDFVDWIRDEHDDLAYRVVFSAYCTTTCPWEKTAGYATLHVLPEGGFILKASGDEELHLVDEDELRAFHTYLERRYCRDEYPDMSAWERQQHEWYMEWP
ncbi:hypothetical protein [Lentzea tibetensis]|uniref:hypothetical protein n=1 Tax=Lentzea tibetensis TaxID=2591470 RepID=UPI0011B4C624|nr:hypothetical protein [Lentzea tibetensis]